MSHSIKEQILKNKLRLNQQVQYLLHRTNSRSSIRRPKSVLYSIVPPRLGIIYFLFCYTRSFDIKTDEVLHVFQQLMMFFYVLHVS